MGSWLQGEPQLYNMTVAFGPGGVTVIVAEKKIKPAKCISYSKSSGASGSRFAQSEGILTPELKVAFRLRKLC